MAKTLDGKILAERLNKETRQEVAEKLYFKKFGEYQAKPTLAVCLVGDNHASCTYVAVKQSRCSDVGIKCHVRRLPETTTEGELIDVIQGYNNDREIHGILVQLPLPKHMSKSAVVNAIDPNKDVDGFHSLNIGGIVHRTNQFSPCTPLAIRYILKEYGIGVSGKNVVIVNRGIVVGTPLALMLMDDDATVTVCHDRTKDVAEYTRKADIVITAVGNRDSFVLTGDMIQKDAIVVDVGVSKRDGKLVGDADETVAEKASWLTPPVGGIGPLTVAFLLKNTVKAAKGKMI